MLRNYPTTAAERKYEAGLRTKPYGRGCRTAPPFFVASLQTATDAPAQYIFKAGLISGLVRPGGPRPPISAWEVGRKSSISFPRSYLGPTSGSPTIRTLARSQATALYRHLAL